MTDLAKLSSDGLAHLLWTDDSVLEARHRKSAAALLAIAKLLRNENPLGDTQDEFLDCFDKLCGFDEGVFTQVWTDPYAYFWLRLAYELLRALQRGEEPARLASDHCRATGAEDLRQALIDHLDQFKRLALAASHIAGENLVFDSPLVAEAPLAIPGCAVTLEGEGEISIFALRDGRLSVEIDGQRGKFDLVGSEAGSEQAVGHVRLRMTPRVVTAGCDIRLQPALYNQAALDFRPLVAPISHAYQQEHAAALEAAVTVLEARAPIVFEQFREFIQLVALKPADAGSYRDNLSHSEFPGAIVAQPVYHPYYLAHVLVHEFHHNRLFCIEEHETLLESSHTSLEQQDRHYSPWRNDARPMHGIVHGLYVFVPVGYYWLNVLENTEESECSRSLVMSQLLMGQLQMEIARHQIFQRATLTAFGREFMGSLSESVDDLGRRIRQLADPEHSPWVNCLSDGSLEGNGMSVREKIDQHIALHASRNEAANPREILNW